MTDERRERYATALAENYGDYWESLTGEEQDAWRLQADAVMAVADEELRAVEERHREVLQRTDQANNSLMEEVQRYAAGDEQPVLWSVYNEMHKRALNAEAESTRLRRELTSAERIRENADFHLGQEMARRQLAEKESTRLRAELKEMTKTAKANHGLHGAAHEEAEEHAAALDRVRALHEYIEDADYCDVCSNHGDIAWPCATIAALDGADPEPRLCVECGHPKAQHQDADEPVSVGLCTACDADDSDDAWHNYEPEGQQ
ncbi:hypothetical protein [Streptomyces nigrescens]